MLAWSLHSNEVTMRGMQTKEVTSDDSKGLKKIKHTLQ